MSSLVNRKSRLSVEFSDIVRERGKLREVTMEFTPYVITIRLKGMRQRFEVSPAGIYNYAVHLAVEKRRAESGKKKKVRR